jgi:hypothetical protein
MGGRIHGFNIILESLPRQGFFRHVKPDVVGPLREGTRTLGSKDCESVSCSQAVLIGARR